MELEDPRLVDTGEADSGRNSGEALRGAEVCTGTRKRTKAGLDGLISDSNILLTDLDRELERRGHAFCRYADDCNIYVRSLAAGERVMANLTRFLGKRLKLTVNAAKSAPAHRSRRSPPWHRKAVTGDNDVELFVKSHRNSPNVGIVRRPC